MLEVAGVIPGIKVDTGAKPLALFPGETVTEGLDGLRERLAEYSEMGARFAKWRATIFIGEGLPTDGAIAANGHAMARYAALCQEAGIVPIVEPEVLMDGDHDLAACEEATGRTLDGLYRALAEARVDLPGSLLKVNMVVPGKGCATQDDDATIAAATVRCLTAHVPAEVPGVVFLSGGMSDEQATSRLNEMNRPGGPGEAAPWQLSFSYGRALQAPSLAAWKGDDANIAGRAGRARASGPHERPRAKRRIRGGAGARGRLTAPPDPYHRVMPERRHVGIRDVARAAGVSITTVSHALNEKGGVSEETRRRVREVATELGYRPDPRGRQLASGRTGLIALTVSMPDGVHAPVEEFAHNANLIDAATSTAIARGLALVIVPAGEVSIWDRLPLDGLIVVDPVPDDPAIRELGRGTPIVTSARCREERSTPGWSTTTTRPARRPCSTT